MRADDDPAAAPRGREVDPNLPDEVSTRFDQVFQEIQVDEPDLVIDAIREVVGKVRANGNANAPK